MVTLINESKSKIAVSLIAFGIIALSTATGCGPNAPTLGVGGSDFNLQRLMVTKIYSDNRISISSTLKWASIGGADHYELARIQNNGSEVPIGDSKITPATLKYSDPNLQEDASYKYIIRAIDANNKVITKGETTEIKPITSTDLQATQIQELKPPPETNTVSREANLKWSSVANSDLYYASIANNQTSKQIFGIFTKETSVNINVTSSPIDPPEIIKQELPVLTGGLEKAVGHKFNVYTIKFNNADLNKATAIGLRQSSDVLLIL